MSKATITVPVIGETLNEVNENFFVNLSNVTNGTIVDGQGVCTIVNDDSGPGVTLQFSNSSYSASEGDGTATIEVIRTGNLSATVSVAYTTSNGTATAGADYNESSGRLEFISGVASQKFTVSIIDDSTAEAPETVNISASGILRLPSKISNRSISAIDLSHAQSGVNPSISTGTDV